MNIRIGQAFSFHQIGKRNYQEDSRFPDADKPKDGQRYFVVCDGVGGSEKGEVASRIVCETLGSSLSQTDLYSDFTNSDFGKCLNDAYDALDRATLSVSSDMGTTMTFICFHKGGCTMAHIGDSRIYQIRPEEGIIYRSDDHSLVNSMVHDGLITPEQGMNHSQRNVITRYMEPVNADESRCMATVMRSKDVKAGDYFFLCTDGVLHCLSDEKLCKAILEDRNDEDKIKNISRICLESEDNNTGYLIPVVSVETDTFETEPDIQETDCQTTKKIKVQQYTIEDIESQQEQTGNNIFKWFRNKLKNK